MDYNNCGVNPETGEMNCNGETSYPFKTGNLYSDIFIYKFLDEIKGETTQKTYKKDDIFFSSTSNIENLINILDVVDNKQVSSSDNHSKQDIANISYKTETKCKPGEACLNGRPLPPVVKSNNLSLGLTDDKDENNNPLGYEEDSYQDKSYNQAFSQLGSFNREKPDNWAREIALKQFNMEQLQVQANLQHMSKLDKIAQEKFEMSKKLLEAHKKLTLANARKFNS